MDTATRARERVHEEPFLLEALAAGVCNHAAVARYLGFTDREEAVATALARYADDLDRSTVDRSPRVRLERGVAVGTDAADPLLSVGGVAVAEGGDRTAVLASGVEPADLGVVLGALRAAGVAVAAAGAADERLVVVVDGRAGADTLRVTERALGAVPTVE
jgi:hypothetical protein